MQVIKKITLDMADNGAPGVIDTVQGDSNTRVVYATLTSEGVPWIVPQDTFPAIAFKKPSGRVGLYDTLADGSSAISVDGNKVSLIIAPQVLEEPGDVKMSFVLLDNMTKRIATFPMLIHVMEDPSGGATISNDYYNMSVFMPQPSGGGSDGHLIRVSSVYPNGQIADVETIPDLTGSAVLFISQNLNNDQMLVARANIGAASKKEVDEALARLVESAPETLDTLAEVAAALGNDPNFATTVMNLIGNKVDKVDGLGLSQESYTTYEKIKLQGIQNGAQRNVDPDFDMPEGYPGHIKNRTHWCDIDGTIHKLNNAYIDAEWMATVNSVQGVLLENTNVLYDTQSKKAVIYRPGFGLELQKIYLVAWDGVQYECVCKFKNGVDGIIERYLGNPALSEVPGTNTTEPFYICQQLDSEFIQIHADKRLFVYKAEIGGKTTLSIFGDKKEYNKLPEEFLPETAGGIQFDSGYVDEDDYLHLIESGEEIKQYDPIKLNPNVVWQAKEITKYGDILPMTEVDFGFSVTTRLDTTDVVLEVGKKYRVSWNGAYYVYECKEKDFILGRTERYIGNQNFSQFPSGEPSGGPFYIFQIYNADGTPFYERNRLNITKLEKGGIVPVSISGEYKIYEKLPEKYLYSSVPVIISANRGQVIAVKSVDGNGYPLSWETVDLPTPVEPAPTPEPVIPVAGLSKENQILVVSETSGRKATKYKTQDKPFYDTPTGGDTLVWDGDITGRARLQGTRAYKISDVIPTRDDLENGCYFRVYSFYGNVDNTEEVFITPDVAQDRFDEDGYASFRGRVGQNTEYVVFVIPRDNYGDLETDGIHADESGTYFRVSNIATDYETGIEYPEQFTSHFSIPGFTRFYGVKPIDSRYLPANVPIVKSAHPGQTIIVKNVDRYGKPTEWEAVDFSNDDSSYGNYVINLASDEFDPESAETTQWYSCSENYDNFANILYSGGTVWIDVSSSVGTTLRFQPNVWQYIPGTGIVITLFHLVSLETNGLIMQPTQITFVFPNGTWTPPVE